jgi:group I intron endonuclease
MEFFYYLCIMIITGIYIIRNTVNNKVYVGSATDIRKRWRDHKWHLNHNKHHNSHLQASWNKYGINAFEFSVIFECKINDLLINERKLILKFKSSDNNYGYNVNDPEHSFLNKKHSEKTKQILSLQKQGKNNPMYGKTGINHPRFNTKSSIETKNKISLSKIGIPTHRQTNVKLKPNDIINIRKIYNEQKISQIKIAKLYGVSDGTINLIIAGKTWSHVA